MNQILGHVTCPLCGNGSATVHQQKNRGNKKYFRCYNGEHGDCGTIQCTGAGGQRFISHNMQAIKSEQLTEVVEDAKQTAKEESIKTATKDQRLVEKNKAPKPETETQPKKRSRLTAFFEDE